MNESTTAFGVKHATNSNSNSIAIFDQLGIRFAYPASWSVEVSDDGSRTTVNLHSRGSGFAFVTLDDSRPDPQVVADEALQAMREEYPELDATPTPDLMTGSRSSLELELMAGQPAVGHDLEFFSLDLITQCLIRSCRTPRHTLLLFAQWSDLDDEEIQFGRILHALRRTLVESAA